MEIDVMDGYRPNRWANFHQPSRITPSYKKFNIPNTVHFKGEQVHDDDVIQENVSVGKKMGVNQTIPIVKSSQILSTRKAIDPTLNEQIINYKNQGNFVDIYV